MRYVNCTGKTVRLRIGPHACLTLLPAEKPAHVRAGSLLKGPRMDLIAVRYARTAVIEHLPEARDRTVLLVEPFVGFVAALGGRYDVYSVEGCGEVALGLVAWDPTPEAAAR